MLLRMDTVRAALCPRRINLVMCPLGTLAKLFPVNSVGKRVIWNLAGDQMFRENFEIGGKSESGTG